MYVCRRVFPFAFRSDRGVYIYMIGYCYILLLGVETGVNGRGESSKLQQKRLYFTLFGVVLLLLLLWYTVVLHRGRRSYAIPAQTLQLDTRRTHTHAVVVDDIQLIIIALRSIAYYTHRAPVFADYLHNNNNLHC